MTTRKREITKADILPMPEYTARRREMRQAIVDNAPVADREALAAKIGANETALVMMRSNCVDHWRTVLTPEQFAEVIAMASGK